MKNNLAKNFRLSYEKGVRDGGIYWTAIMTIAIHNLYGYKAAFDKIEAEMGRIVKEQSLEECSEDKMYKLIRDVETIRGGKYFEGMKFK